MAGRRSDVCIRRPDKCDFFLIPLRFKFRKSIVETFPARNFAGVPVRIQIGTYLRTYVRLGHVSCPPPPFYGPEVEIEGGGDVFIIFRVGVQ